MSHKHLFTVSILTSLLLTVAAHGDSGASRRNADSTSQRSQPAAPVIHRRGPAPGRLVQPIEATRRAQRRTGPGRPSGSPLRHGRQRSPGTVHQSPSAVSQRLLQMRRAVVYDDLPPPSSPPARRIETTRASPTATSRAVPRIGDSTSGHDGSGPQWRVRRASTLRSASADMWNSFPRS